MGRAAHEVNNALNGVGMNLEVVRLRAAAGKDPAAAAPFAAAAAEEHEAVTRLAGALLALGRAPRAGQAADVREVLAHVAALVAPVIRHQGVAVEVAADRPAPTAADPVAVRLAVVWAVERAAVSAADDRTGRLRCNLSVGPGPTLELDPAPAAPSGPGGGGAPDLLAAHGIRAARVGSSLRIAFPAP